MHFGEAERFMGQKVDVSTVTEASNESLFAAGFVDFSRYSLKAALISVDNRISLNMPSNLFVN